MSLSPHQPFPRPVLSPDEMDAAICALAARARNAANAADEAFLKTADPRAVQGGAICEEAQAWYKVERLLFAAANAIETSDAL